MSFSRYSSPSRVRLFLRTVGISLLLVLSLLALFFYSYTLPYAAPGVVAHNQYLDIPTGASAREAAWLLEEAGIIRSAPTFLLSLRAQGLESYITRGTYYFDQPESMRKVLTRVTTSDYRLPVETITLFEGEANFQYAERLAQEFPTLSQAEFLAQAREHEGYLFPDTYTFPRRITAKEVIQSMRDNFQRQIEPLKEQLAQSPYTLQEIITLASLVETEAGSASYETKQRVAGILQKRLEIGMLLQADAVFSYIYQEHLPRVLYRHLEVDSPYNLYTHSGLPPGPIGNPGLESIRATLNPLNPQGHLYYLTGHDGLFYYATTLAQHEQNRQQHLQY